MVVLGNHNMESRGVARNSVRGGENERRDGDTFDSLRLLNPPIVCPCYQTFYCPQCPLAPIINSDLKCFSLLLQR